MVKKYIIMCGGKYVRWITPRHFTKILGEELVARTIRLLRENGIKDISISTNNPAFSKFGVPILEHDNLYIANGIGNVQGDWFNAFYPTNEPVCYIFGDVFFSPEAIKTIVNTPTDDIELFGSQPPFAENYIKTHEEPFALKVQDVEHFKKSLEKTRQMEREHKFWRKALVWEFFTVVKNAPLQKKMGEYTTDYTVINDYTCDIDNIEDIAELNKIMIKIGGIEMVKLEAIEEFTLGKFNELKNLVRKDPTRNEKGYVYLGDVFECKEDLYNYLTGENKYGRTFVKVIEIIPEKKEEIKIEAKVKFDEPKPKKQAIIKKSKK